LSNNKTKGEKMETRDKEEIRKAVRESYGQIARAGIAPSETSQAATCCDPSGISTETIQDSPCDCSGPDFSLKQVSTVIGYSKEDIDSVPEGANMGLGCGNPVALASLKPGETVLDLGSGGGFDCFLAAKQVGETGRSPDKLSVYQDAYRALKPGGRLAISDIVATAALPDEIKENLALVAACVGGAATIEDIDKMLKKVGFQDIQITTNDNSRELIKEWAPNESKNVGDYVVSAYIEAVKPLSNDLK
jgi:SAM-dependent methyltransferase